MRLFVFLEINKPNFGRIGGEEFGIVFLEINKPNFITKLHKNAKIAKE